MLSIRVDETDITIPRFASLVAEVNLEETAFNDTNCEINLARPTFLMTENPVVRV